MRYSQFLSRCLNGRSKWRLLAAVCAALGIMDSRAKADVIFQDTFANGSTLNGTSTPSNGNETSYDLAANKAQSPAASIAPGALKFGLAGTTSGINEAQAVFTGTPVVLTNPGDAIDYQVTFTDTGINLSSSTSSGQLDFGLYNTGGSAPLPGTLQSAGLVSTSTSSDSGGVVGWNGYVAQQFAAGSSNKIVTRPAQTSGADNTDQELIGNNFSSSNSYHEPAGTALPLSSASAGISLTSGSQYTNDLNISLAADGSDTIIENLYAGATASGTPLLTSTTTEVTGANLFNDFSGLAVGYRATAGTLVPSQLNVNSIEVSFSSVPEPIGMSVMAIGGFGLALRRRSRTADNGR